MRGLLRAALRSRALRPRALGVLALGALALGLPAAPARAATPAEEAMAAEMDRARAEIAGQVQLAAYDLIDELVYGWISEPLFESPTPVVLAGVSVPVGLGTGLAALLENHVAAALVRNPQSNLTLVHCPACTAVVVRSGPEGTVVSRGVDDPRVLAELGEDGSRHALFIDVEAEGSWLVLRARITRLTPELPIVWSHTIATSASTPALLREPRALKSAEDARQEYLDVLRGRGPVAIPLRFTIRAYARPDGGGVPAPPFLWLQTGVELDATESAAWTSSLVLGYSFIPEAYQGLLAQSRINRLINGKARSLTGANLYGFFGASVISVWGPATASFRTEILTADELLRDSNAEDPRATFGAIQFGLDLRVGNRVGVASFLETMPSLRSSENFGWFINPAGLPFSSLGTEVSFCF